MKQQLFSKLRVSIPTGSFIAAIFTACMLQLSAIAFGQATTQNNNPESFTLQQCIDYSLQNQPALKQSILNVSVARATNAISLGGWLPQLNTSIGFVHYTQLPTSYITNPSNPGGGEVPIKTGVVNTFIPGLTATQTIFSPTLLYAATSAKLNVKAAKQIIDSTKIDLVATVSKSFYNLLLTLKEIDVLKEDTVRLARNVTDAYHQYKGGIVDETDYEEATITLNNSLAQLRQANENVVPQYAILKQLMGYPPQNQFNVVFDTAEMMREIAIDTTEQLKYEKRIEYQQLATYRALQHKFTNYNWVTLAPSLGVYFDYNYEYENSNLPSLFSAAYPNSLIGVSLTLPIFTGFTRLESVRRSKLEEKILELSEVNLKAGIYAEYTQAMANYRGNLYNMQVLQENVNLAKRTYTVVEMQYKQGIVAYLNVITAESNLITSEIGYINALFTVLSSKIDLEKAMGNIPY
jgi:outer membrane protein TolC